MAIPDHLRAAWRAKARRADFRASGVVAAERMVGPVEPGMRVIGLTKGQFSFGDLLRVVVDATGPADLTVSTWTAAAADVTHMQWLLEQGRLRSFQLIVDRSFVTRKPEYGELVLEAFGPAAVRIANIHAKFALISAGDWHVVVRTSMNLNQNKRWEDFDVEDNPDLFSFFETLVEEIRATTPEGFATEQQVWSAFKEQAEKARRVRAKKKGRVPAPSLPSETMDLLREMERGGA